MFAFGNSCSAACSRESSELQSKVGAIEFHHRVGKAIAWLFNLLGSSCQGRECLAKHSPVVLSCIAPISIHSMAQVRMSTLPRLAPTYPAMPMQSIFQFWPHLSLSLFSILIFLWNHSQKSGR